MTKEQRLQIASSLVREAVTKIREHDNAMMQALIRGRGRPTAYEVAHHQQRIEDLTVPLIEAVEQSSQLARIRHLRSYSVTCTNVLKPSDEKVTGAYGLEVFLRSDVMGILDGEA